MKKSKFYRITLGVLAFTMLAQPARASFLHDIMLGVGRFYNCSTKIADSAISTIAAHPYSSLAVGGVGILVGWFLLKKGNKDHIFVLDPLLKTGQFIAIRRQDGMDVFKRITDERAAAIDVRNNKATDIVIYQVTVDHSKNSLQLRQVNSTEKNSWVQKILG